jgi:Uma2 family endonuclease
MNARANIEHLKFPVSRYSFSVEEYHKLADAGVLHEDSRVELIEGELIKMPPIGPPHASSTEILVESFILKLARRAIVRIQDPVWLNDHTEPEPDIVIARLQPERYRKSHPRPGDILQIVEIADSTLEYDRNVKMPLYAEHGIPEAWLLDVGAKQLEIYLDPSDTAYRRCLKPPPDAIVTPTLFPDVQINLAELFGDA